MAIREMPQEVFDLAFGHLISVYGWPSLLVRVHTSVAAHALRAEKDGDTEMSEALTVLAERFASLAEWAEAQGL